ncbi:hypothetical protein LEMLEM_LOCUS25921, partial [Lemmus lemmus]
GKCNTQQGGGPRGEALGRQPSPRDTRQFHTTILE